MKGIICLLLFFNSLCSLGQINIISIDTSAACRTTLHNEYKSKFQSLNTNMGTLTSSQQNIIKEIYNDVQNNFFDKIDSNNFICDDKVNPYLQKLMYEVLEKNGVNKKDYRILLSRNSTENAYNTGDGTIVVHYGLFLSLDNEDELVFVISHEIGHQYLNHVKEGIESYVKVTTSDEIKAKTKAIERQKYGKAAKANDLLKDITYQNYNVRRKKEIEADSLGFVFYKKTLRNPKAAISVLEKLNVSDREKDSLTIADYKLIFEKNGFLVKQKYFEEEQSLFVKYDKDKGMDVDSLKSHPDCATRIKLIKNNLDVKLSENYSVSDNFSEIKKNSDYQNLLNLIALQRYGISLYEGLKLYKKDTQNEVLRNIIYLNLVKIRNSRENHTINRYVPRRDNLNNTSSLNRFISFINNIKTTDLELIINNFKS
ncbi:M48 family metallopeptidase [Flavobacterium suzhouense]|uniref:M48 family metallopeptidase n=1 Tax=Flavobacterium suzhouense TaxID=1529638 RepID=A0ABW5NTC6_9FLAO